MIFLREIAKYLFRGIVLPILTLLMAGILLVNLIPQDQIRTYAGQEIGKRIGRQIVIGPFHVGVRGLTLDSLKVSEPPNFDSGLLFDAKGIRLGWHLKSLWKGFDIRKKAVTSSSGQFQIDQLKNPNYQASQFAVSWSLTDIDNSGARLNGWAKLDQGPGLLINADQLMRKSPAARVALTPVQALKNLEKLGVMKLGLPDFKHWPIDSIKGRYTFKEGIMTIDPFTIASPQLGLATQGTVNLGSGALLLDAQLTAPEKSVIGAMDAKLKITGTTANPKVDLSQLKKKAFQATLKNILENPKDAKKDIDAALKNIFH